MADLDFSNIIVPANILETKNKLQVHLFTKMNIVNIVEIIPEPIGPEWSFRVILNSSPRQKWWNFEGFPVIFEKVSQENLPEKKSKYAGKLSKRY